MTKKNVKKVVVKNQGNARQLIYGVAADGDWATVKEWLQRDPSLINVMCVVHT
jgi:hypothetical protein